MRGFSYLALFDKQIIIPYTSTEYFRKYETMPLKDKFDAARRQAEEEELQRHSTSQTKEAERIKQAEAYRAECRRKFQQAKSDLQQIEQDSKVVDLLKEAKEILHGRVYQTFFHRRQGSSMFEPDYYSQYTDDSIKPEQDSVDGRQYRLSWPYNENTQPRRGIISKLFNVYPAQESSGFRNDQFFIEIRLFLDKSIVVLGEWHRDPISYGQWSSDPEILETAVFTAIQHPQYNTPLPSKPDLDSSY